MYDEERGKAGVPEHNAEPAEGLRHGAGVARGYGLLKEEAAGNRDDPDEGERCKEATPRGVGEHERAEDRGDGGRDDDHGLDEREHRFPSPPFVDVFDHRGRDRGGGAAADGLQDPEDDQVPDIPRCGAPDTCGDVKGEPDEQDGPARPYRSESGPQKSSPRLKKRKKRISVRLVRPAETPKKSPMPGRAGR